MQLGRYAFREVMNMHIYDLTGSTPLVYWPFANSTNLEMDSGVSYATGGRGAPRRVSFFDSKTGTFTVETQIFSMDILALLTGVDVSAETSSDIFAVQNVVVDASNKVTLDKTPLVSPAPAVYKFVNGVKSTPVAVSGTSGKELTLTGVTQGDEVQVFYQWATVDGTYKLPILADKFPPFVKIIGDSFFTDEISGELVDGQFTFHKARAMPNFTLSSANSGDPTSLTLTFDLFAYDQADGSQPMLDILLYDE